MAADHISVFPGQCKTSKKRIYIIHCPSCRGFDFERNKKKAAVEFAKKHSSVEHGGKLPVVTK